MDSLLSWVIVIETAKENANFIHKDSPAISMSLGGAK